MWYVVTRIKISVIATSRFSDRMVNVFVILQSLLNYRYIRSLRYPLPVSLCYVSLSIIVYLSLSFDNI